MSTFNVYFYFFRNGIMTANGQTLTSYLVLSCKSTMFYCMIYFHFRYNMMSQYDTEKFCQPPDPDLVCCICQCVLLSPVECPCRHVFCNVCITTWLINHHNCPTCRRRVRQIQLKPVLPMVQNMINRLLMFCDFRDNGCADNVMLELYLGHVETCGYRKIKCCFSRCGQMILLKDKEQHENKDCDFREKLCTGRCGLMIPVCMFDSHDCCEELRRFNRGKLFVTLESALGVMVFNASFYIISVISWRPVLFVEETGVPWENHKPAAICWQTLSHKVVSSTPYHEQDSN